ncbi:hypothetical protein [Brachyspira pilosicoli]|uniref:hypothetical protein n=1 Tax=Brachyspira pilosicoli TaxID=52584 RepID=UPI000E1B4377|nr:hypothetical protein [Brachyspira pilosicoli]SUW03992.1 unclassified [Brachyspira pilosicoli]SUW06200.1 unclassified [Brachyspira pilosicoli]
MKKIKLDSSVEIAFRYKGKIDDDIWNLIDLNIAFIADDRDDPVKLFVKTGEYKKITKTEPAIDKYVNVPAGYWIIASNYLLSDKKIIQIKQVKVLSNESFRSKYNVLDNDEPNLFDSVKENLNNIGAMPDLSNVEVTETENGTPVIKIDLDKKKNKKA